MKPFSLLIIGAGRMGAFYDTPGSNMILSHAHAFSTHPGFHLVGFVDTERRQAELAADIWGGGAFASAGDAFASQMIDVAVVSAPDEFHGRLLLELADYPLKLVLAEKPLAMTLAEATQITGLYRERDIPLALNYVRRYVPEFNVLQNRIGTGEFGRFLTGTGYYGKGTLHNGSHMVDLIRFLLGEVSDTTTVRGFHDWSDCDPTCSAILELERGGQFIMQGVDSRNYTVFEMDLFFEHVRIRLVDSGFAIEIQDVCEGAAHKGYRILSDGGRHATCLGSALSTMAASLYDHLAAGVQLSCTGDDGVRALAVCSHIIGGL